MKFHTVFITYNRLELTKRAIESYLETVSVPYTFVIADNGSDKDTTDWLLSIEWSQGFDSGPQAVLIGSNRYPGYAANRGWEMLSNDSTHLHRADNDHIFLPGWCEEVERVFQSKKIGQVGLRTAVEEQHARSNTGGNCVIRRSLWDAGLRWDERPWPQLRDEIGPGHTEDSLMSPAVEAMGYTWTRVKRPCIVPISSEHPEHDPDYDYYRRTWADRGINENLYPA